MCTKTLITAFGALTIAFAPPATAAACPVTGPPSFHERVVEEFVDDIFCGRGADVGTSTPHSIWTRNELDVVRHQTAWNWALLRK